MIKKYTRPDIGPKAQVIRLFVGMGLVLSMGAQAALVENLTLGNPKALALGNAVTADPPGVDSIHYNPAGLTRIHGREGLFKLTAAYFNFKVDFGRYHPDAQEQIDIWGTGLRDPVENSTSETDEVVMKVPFVSGRTEWPLPFVVVPTGGAAWRPDGRNYTLGTAAFAPLAAGYRREADDPGSLMGKELALSRITYFSPTIGFKLTDEWSFGVGVHFSYQGLSAITDLRIQHILLGVINTALEQVGQGSDCLGGLFTFCGNSINPFDRAVTLEVDVEAPVSVTGVLGGLWEPTPWFTWGFVYHTEVMNRMKGSYRMTYSQDWQDIFAAVHEELPIVTALFGLPIGLPEQHGKARVNLKTPAHFSTGVSVKVLPAWKVNVDAKWTDWKTWDGLTILFDKNQEFGAVAGLLAPKYASLRHLTIPRYYESVWNFAMGVEHQYNDRLALRFGYEPRNSSIPASKQDVMLPVGDADLFTFGIGYDLAKNTRMDLAVGYYHAKANIPAGSSTNGNSMNIANNILYNPYSGLDIKTENSAYLLESSFSWQF